MKTFGFIESVGYDRVPLFASKAPSNGIPQSLNNNALLGPIRDQGSISKCVSVALTDLVNFNLNGKYVSTDDFFYNNRSNRSVNGMSIIEAFDILHTKGLGGFKSKSYARVGNADALKIALVTNGVAIIALPVYNSSKTDFWNKGKTDELEGGHAVLIVGYNNKGFIIRNSWGKGYGDNGLSILPYNEFDSIMECWTLIE